MSAFQSIGMGMSLWLPAHGTAFLDVDPYSYRSAVGSSKVCDWGEAGWARFATNATGRGYARLITTGRGWGGI